MGMPYFEMTQGLWKGGEKVLKGKLIGAYCELAHILMAFYRYGTQLRESGQHGFTLRIENTFQANHFSTAESQRGGG